MSDLQWLFFGLYAVIVFIVAVPILLLILWVINKWLLKGRMRLLYRVLLSIAIPLIFIGYIFADIHFSLYSTSNMNHLLEDVGVGIKLPPYEITEYKNEPMMGDDFRDTYQMVFDDATIKSMQPTLDSLCNANEKWTKKKDEYVYATDNMEKEFRDSLIIRPNKGTATFVRYMW
jgi:hypothetical protein